ncbi:EamA family transporter [Candidatus Saccharibacteria bacterium]|nr:EamA family transporter [Candidatus Saccharibacteria bacterium]
MKNANGPVVVAVLQTLLFASMGIWVRMMQESFTTYQQVYIRVFLAAVFSWVIFAKVIKLKQLKCYRAKTWGVYALRALMAFSVGVLLFTYAIQNTKFATVSFVASLPTLGILSWLMFRERLAKGSLPFIMLSVVGLVMLTNIDLTNFRLGKGELAAIVSMIGFNIGYLLSRKHPDGSNKYQDATIVLTFGWIVPFLAVLTNGERIWPAHITTVAWVGLIASVIINIVGLVMINYVFAHMKAYVAGNIFLLEGVVALIIGMLLYNESVSVRELVGAGVILACAYMVAQKDRRGQTIAAEDPAVEGS